MQPNFQLGFWRGFGSALVLRRPALPELKFTFRGRDILGLTTEQALRQDWVALGKDFEASMRRIDQHEQSGSHSAGEPASR